jgi:hypothetical protein
VVGRQAIGSAANLGKPPVEGREVPAGQRESVVGAYLGLARLRQRYTTRVDEGFWLADRGLGGRQFLGG